MSELRKEVGRASVDVDGLVYTLIVYHTTHDEWDDPERRVTERVALLRPGAVLEPGAVETHLGMLPGMYDGGERLIYDGGGATRRHEERLALIRSEREAVELERSRKIAAGDAERVTRQQCPGCDHAAEGEDFEERIYECSRCGSTGRGDEGRRCGDCHIFRAKLADLSCPSCEQAIDELGSVEGHLVDGVFVQLEEAIS